MMAVSDVCQETGSRSRVREAEQGGESPGLAEPLAIVEAIEHEIRRTLDWRNATGMRPATDTSDFCNVPVSGLNRLSWWMRELRRRLEAKEHTVTIPVLPGSEQGGESPSLAGPSQLAIGIAARCWCDPDTENTEMDVVLGTAFAKRVDRLLDDLEAAWIIISNSSNWSDGGGAPNWKEAAERWRDRYLVLIGALEAKEEDDG